MSNPKKSSIVTDVQIHPVKPKGGLVAFCSFLLHDSLYCSCIAIFTKVHGGYRLVYPTKKSGTKEMDVFHPVNTVLGHEIEQAVLIKYYEVTKNDRYRVPHI